MIKLFLNVNNDKIKVVIKMRNTYALVNLKYLKDNIKNIIDNYNYEYYFGVVKANCYGHGFETIPTMDEAGINYFCVAMLEEALEVRKYTKKPILVFGYVNPSDIEIVEKNNITLSIISVNYFKELLKVNPKIKVHLKINSGMNRFGINNKDEVLDIVNKLKKSNMNLEGIYTHFATTGVSDIYYDKQKANFEEITSLINLREIPIVHLFNSISTARHKKIAYANGIRLGLMMYGFTFRMGNISFITKLKRKLLYKNISPTMLHNNLDLKKVLSLHSEVININNLTKEEFVGYGAKYIAKDNELIAVVPIGHADGVTECYKKVMINDKIYPIIAICMDYIMIKVDKSVNIHDKVDLINEHITIGKDIIGDTPHHLLVSISNRVKRIYKEN